MTEKHILQPQENYPSQFERFPELVRKKQELRSKVRSLFLAMNLRDHGRFGKFLDNLDVDESMGLGHYSTEKRVPRGARVTMPTVTREDPGVLYDTVTDKRFGTYFHGQLNFFTNGQKEIDMLENVLSSDYEREVITFYNQLLAATETMRLALLRQADVLPDGFVQRLQETHIYKPRSDTDMGRASIAEITRQELEMLEENLVEPSVVQRFLFGKEVGRLHMLNLAQDYAYFLVYVSELQTVLTQLQSLNRVGTARGETGLNDAMQQM